MPVARGQRPSECLNTKSDIRGKLPGSIALSSAVTWPAISDKLTGKHGIDFSTAKLGFCGVSPPTLNRLAFGVPARAERARNLRVINRCKRRRRQKQERETNHPYGVSGSIGTGVRFAVEGKKKRERKREKIIPRSSVIKTVFVNETKILQSQTNGRLREKLRQTFDYPARLRNRNHCTGSTQKKHLPWIRYWLKCICSERQKECEEIIGKMLKLETIKSLWFHYFCVVCVEWRN